jgi:hypothetical protein
MAKINIEYDTNTKKMNATMDGKKIDNLHSISTYHRGEGKHAMQVMSHKDNKEHDMSEQHMVYASEDFTQDNLLEKLSKKFKKQWGHH